jgi:Kyakuja-Dileera-Zisupton transposase
MDYLIFSALLFIVLPWIVITYDIGCQWSKNMRKRMDDYPDAMRIKPDTRVDVGVPSWHINSHGKDCRDNFSLGYLAGAGRTCGEEVETSWSHTNALAPSVREMGPAARHDTLNDHWGGWNFHKIVGFRMYSLHIDTSSPNIYIFQCPGTFFLQRFQTAFVMSKRHQEIADQLSTTFSKETIKKWEEMVKTWDNDKSAPNPYAEPQCGKLLCP